METATRYASEGFYSMLQCAYVSEGVEVSSTSLMEDIERINRSWSSINRESRSLAVGFFRMATKSICKNKDKLFSLPIIPLIEVSFGFTLMMSNDKEETVRSSERRAREGFGHVCVNDFGLAAVHFHL